MKKALLASLVLSIIAAVPIFAVDYSSQETIKQVQEALNSAGYNCGTPDGIAGNGTKAQIEKYREDMSLSPGEEIDTELCQSLGLEEIPETHLDFEDKSDGSLLKGLTITAAEVKEIYEEYEKAWESYPEDVDEQIQYEENVSKQIAEKHGLTPHQADNVYYYVSVYGVPELQKGFTIKHGELLDAKANGTTLIIKAKIRPSYSNDATIKQNYFNVCDLIKNQGAGDYDEIQYWAVADMTDGSESKVVSFTVTKKVIDLVKSDSFAENKLGDYLDDLWVHQSLR